MKKYKFDRKMIHDLMVGWKKNGDSMIAFDCLTNMLIETKLSTASSEVKDGVTVKNGDWIENLEVSLNFYRRTGKYENKWIARLGNPTCLNVKKIESDTLQRLLSKIEDELFAVKKPTPPVVKLPE